MMLNRIFTIGVFLLSAICFSQEKSSKLNQGNKLSEEYAYFKAIDIYEKVAAQGYKSVELFEKLGDAYFFNGEYAKAHKWYDELFKINEIAVDPIYYYRFSQVLKSVGNVEKSQEYLNEFSNRNKKDSRSLQYIENRNYLDEIEDNSNRYTINDAGVNSSFSDYGAAIFKDKVVFTSSRVPDGEKGKRDNWTYDYFSSLYIAPILKSGALGNVEVFAKEIQTEYHESAPFFSKDGNTMYFTKTNEGRKNSKSKKAFLKIYKATLVSGKWDYIVELPFNNNEYNCAHPILSPDEKFLYFVSDMPGGYGDNDIYKVAITGADSYGTPINLGKNINTSGKETFPIINSNNELYFASDGHLGLGGLDIFATNIQFDNYNSKVVNLGKPINSEFDDFGFVRLEDDIKLGFFSSNRDGGKGKDDIYSFVELVPLVLTTKIGGQIIDAMTQEPIPNVVVTIYDQNHKLLANTVTDQNGRSPSITDNNPRGNIYYVHAEIPGYDAHELSLDSKTADLEKGFIMNILQSKKNVEVGDDLAKILAIKGVLFDLDKYNIRFDTEVELQKIVQLMNDYPSIEIEVRAHTDSRHTNSYNKRLSKKRANSTKDYLIANGISKKRIGTKACGELYLLNHCENDVYCTELEHEVNRRCEFIVEKS